MQLQKERMVCYDYRCKEERTFSKEDVVKLLDSAFLDIEGRPLTKRNKEKVFGKYGKIRHIPYKEDRTTGHVWSLIYLEDEDRWGHFDMTMD